VTIEFTNDDCLALVKADRLLILADEELHRIADAHGLRVGELFIALKKHSAVDSIAEARAFFADFQRRRE
jgi:hypothetical protein